MADKNYGRSPAMRGVDVQRKLNALPEEERIASAVAAMPLIVEEQIRDGIQTMGEVIKQKCCDDFVKATLEGSDNEEWESLLYIDPDDGKIKMGSGLPEINFCPWCSAPVEQPA